MAASNSIYEDNSEYGSRISRQDIDAAMAKAAELRSLHAALLQGSSPSAANFCMHAASPVSRQAPPQFSAAQDYPVFTPIYEDRPSSFFPHSRNYSAGWADPEFHMSNANDTIQSYYRTATISSRKALPSKPDGWHACPAAEDQESISGFCLQASPAAPDCTKSKRNSLQDSKNGKKSNIPVLSWLFPRGKKKKKNKSESFDLNQRHEDFGTPSIDALKCELARAKEDKNAALNEVSEMKLSVGNLSEKLENLETYCAKLNKALRQVKSCPQPAVNFVRSGESGGERLEDQMPVSKEVMVEGFLQVMSEARLSVRHFCKTLFKQIEENDHTTKENLNCLLQPYKLSLNSKYSKAVVYLLEAFVNQSLYQDFENCIFQKNGAPKLLDPKQERKAKFQLFVSLRNLSWNEVLRKGTKYYSEEFGKFCDQKMSGVIGLLGWTRPWPEQLLQAFFVAAKCIWLVHLLAFSFDPALGIFRVDENRPFDANYMEDMFGDKQRPHGPGRVKIMVVPGFYVHDEVLRCKVLCRYKGAPNG